MPIRPTHSPYLTEQTPYEQGSCSYTASSLQLAYHIKSCLRAIHRHPYYGFLIYLPSDLSFWLHTSFDWRSDIFSHVKHFMPQCYGSRTIRFGDHSSSKVAFIQTDLRSRSARDELLLTLWPMDKLQIRIYADLGNMVLRALLSSPQANLLKTVTGNQHWRHGTASTPNNHFAELPSQSLSRDQPSFKSHRLRHTYSDIQHLYLAATLLTRKRHFDELFNNAQHTFAITSTCFNAWTTRARFAASILHPWVSYSLWI